jgi:hypothetical protein
MMVLYCGGYGVRMRTADRAAPCGNDTVDPNPPDGDKIANGFGVLSGTGRLTGFLYEGCGKPAGTVKERAGSDASYINGIRPWISRETAAPFSPRARVASGRLGDGG